eukprot:8714528-Pyramimonas_sp.AAC.1
MDVGDTMGQWCVVILRDRLVLDLDVLDDRVVVQVHRYPSDNMVPLRAILRRLNESSSSFIHSSADIKMYSACVVSLHLMSIHLIDQPCGHDR